MLRPMSCLPNSRKGPLSGLIFAVWTVAMGFDVRMNDLGSGLSMECGQQNCFAGLNT